MKVAVLEDNPDILDYLRTALEMAGHTVYMHTQGFSLLESLFSEPAVRYPLPYDLITIDLFLPGNISGLEVITRIRQAIPADKLPIIVITGAGDKDIEQVKTNFPGMPLLRKPFKMITLLQLIEDIKTSR